ncbi:hypothetical protein J8273_6662 [Carpediemonas membranifera]|uniref:Integrase catalytic domain-containing protein n=1 Tax=Carpediemonas membranifera TaxID=201153 RepID=A0A8J6AR10_9EUKA|nr:hypothetical protein J8273_6662 [Carpediemonas membranifera]|eukprot:KAG9392071.1 hypothetical protein J8273_6662 [Carpediemonas membranifera]
MPEELALEATAPGPTLVKASVPARQVRRASSTYPGNARWRLVPNIYIANQGFLVNRDLSRTLEIKRHLRTLALSFNAFDVWSTTLLPYVAWIINSTPHSATGFTPFELLFGTHAASRQINSPDDTSEHAAETPLTSVAEYLTAMDNLLAKLCRKAVKHQSSTRQGRVETQHVPIKPGDYVLRKNHTESKLHGHSGPFKVVEVNPFSAVIVPRLADAPRRTVHLTHLIPVKSDLSEGDLAYFAATDQEEWFVERILRSKPGFLRVKWIGSADKTWEPIDSVKHTPPAKKFLAAHPELLREGSDPSTD